MRVNRLQQVNLMRLWAVHHNGELLWPASVTSSKWLLPRPSSPHPMKPHKDVIQSTTDQERRGTSKGERSMFRLSRLLTIWVLVALILSACQPIQVVAPAASPPNPLDDATVAKIEAIIQQAMTVYPIPGFAMCIVKDGQVVYSKGFGFADLASKRPVTPQSLLLQASVTKSLVAMAILRLAEQGKIDLDEPVTTYLPYFTMADERYKAITVRMLASRTRPPFGRNHLTLP